MQSLGTYLSGSRLRQLLKRAGEHQALVSAIRRLLPEPVSEHCVGAVLEDRRLTLFADSAVWATQLRFLGADLARRIGGRKPAFSEVRVRVAPLAAPIRPAARSLAPISPATARLLLETAASIGDERLQGALRRLALRASLPQGHSKP